MRTIDNKDRDMIFNTINLCSKFTFEELKRIHEVALELEQIRQTVIAREDSPG
jgi:hypothetical protein